MTVKNIATQIAAFAKASNSPPVASGPGSARYYVDPSEPTGIAKALKGLGEMGITGTKPEDILIYKILPPDAMAPAINIMADVRAYFQGTTIPTKS